MTDPQAATCAGFIWYRPVVPWRWHRWRNAGREVWVCADCGAEMITGDY